MAVETTVKRIGGSTFALLPPDLVKSLHLHPGDHVIIDVKRAGSTGQRLMQLRGAFPDLPAFDRREMWGEDD